MSAWAIVMVVALIIAAASAAMAAVNLRLLRRAPAEAPPDAGADAPLISLCIPARNEAANLEACVRGLLGQRGVRLEVLVYDDHSTDGTGAIAARLAAEDPRVRLVDTAPLPPGWNGKQHGCQRMGDAAAGEWLLFTDADVRFGPGAVFAGLDEARARGADLVSTIPRQVTGSLLEHLVVPLIHFILLSYLPIGAMRRSRQPAMSAGCGQYLLVRREAWRGAGGHAAFRASMHDGIMLPRRIREHGGRTDLFDGTAVVACRMYRGARSCWRGFAKNAYEGLGSPALLLFFTVLHAWGHLLPWVAVAAALLDLAAGRPVDRAASALAIAAIGAAFVERAMLALRFRQSWIGVILHPVGVALMTAIQWHSAFLHRAGRREWRGRTHAPLQPTPSSGMISEHG